MQVVNPLEQLIRSEQDTLYNIHKSRDNAEASIKERGLADEVQMAHELHTTYTKLYGAGLDLNEQYEIARKNLRSDELGQERALQQDSRSTLRQIVDALIGSGAASEHMRAYQANVQQQLEDLAADYAHAKQQRVDFGRKVDEYIEFIQGKSEGKLHALEPRKSRIQLAQLYKQGQPLDQWMPTKLYASEQSLSYSS